MSGLDQAFIKAYTQQGGVPTAAIDAVPPVHLAETLQQPPLPQTADLPASEADLPASEADSHFRVMLQVDNFSWPRVCRRLEKAASKELDRLADGLAASMARGHKVLAIGGCQGSDGVTTLVLCAARQLAKRGHRVVMVDANAADPKLAKRLGILAEHGWGEVLSGQLPLDEVVVEESNGDLAVLPLSESPIGEDGPKEYENRLADSLEVLARHYDLVLIDLGSLADPKTANGPLARGIARRLDAIALVHDVRGGNDDQLAEVQRYLAATDIAQVGIIENFTANQDV